MNMSAPVLDMVRLFLPLAITFLAPFCILLARKKPDLREAVSLIAAALAFFAVLWLGWRVAASPAPAVRLLSVLPGIHLRFGADGMSLIFALIATFLWGLATLYNIGYMRSLNEHAQTRYYFCFSVAVFGALGVAFSANVFTLYLFYEIITIFTYPLVAHEETREGMLGGRKYLVYLMGSSKLFLLPAMILTYVLTGTLDFSLGDIQHGIFSREVIGQSPNLVRLVYLLFMLGLAKAAVMPLHNWLPSAMVAPTPVSALLHAVAVVKAGVFCMSRVILSIMGGLAMNGLGLAFPTACAAGVTIVAASLVALTRDDLKARLAYSTISQLSYIILGVALLSPLAVSGGLMHIAHHAFAKITLFFAAGAVYVASRVKSVSAMNGLGRRMPFTFGAFALASLSMIGIPPTAGFVTKWLLGRGAAEAGQTLFLGVLVVSTVLNAAYFAPIVYRAFFLKPDNAEVTGKLTEAPSFMVAPLCVTAAISVAIGLYPDFFQTFVRSFFNSGGLP